MAVSYTHLDVYKRQISTVPVVKPIKVTAPNSVFALGNAFSK